jgi:hypothetical protein
LAINPRLAPVLACRERLRRARAGPG